jgi:2-aminoethylphosphonate-pyruvate transaminase
MEAQPGRDRILFTPGPLTTSLTVKQAMLRDLGSRDAEFMAIVAEIRDRLMRLAGARKESGWEAVLMQGSGTFAIESVISSLVPSGGKLLIAINGAYGERAAKIAAKHGIETVPVRSSEREPIDVDAVEAAIEQSSGITHVFAVACETTTGVDNAAQRLSTITNRRGLAYVVDAMSSFGGMPLDIEDAGYDVVISSSNKCLEGVPGFGFVIGRRDMLEAAEGNARTVSLDLAEQWRALEETGQFRFTPPTHAIVAFRQALLELEEEGGIPARWKRYQANHETLVSGMRRMRFREVVAPEHQSPIITTFHYPTGQRFSFEAFYQLLNGRGFVIYPGKLGETECFRIGTIGRIFPADVEALLVTIREALDEMGVSDGA